MKSKSIKPNKIVALHILKFADGKTCKELIDYYKEHVRVREEEVYATLDFLANKGLLVFDKEPKNEDGTYNCARITVVIDEVTKSLIEELSKP